MGKTQNALDLYDKILSIDKDNKKIMNEKARLLSLTKTVSVEYIELVIAGSFNEISC